MYLSVVTVLESVITTSIQPVLWNKMINYCAEDLKPVAGGELTGEKLELACQQFIDQMKDKISCSER